MSKQTQSHSIESQQSEYEHGYFDFESFIEPYDINRIMRDEAIMKLYHPDEYKAMIKFAKGTTTSAAAAATEDHDMVSRIY